VSNITFVWSDAFLIWAVYAVVAVLIQPLSIQLLGQANRWQNNAVRVCGFLITLLFVAVNHAVVAHLTLAGVWGLIPVAASIYALAALQYHITDTNPLAAIQGVAVTTLKPLNSPDAPSLSPLAPVPTEPAAGGAAPDHELANPWLPNAHG